MLVFEERGKPEYPEKNLSEQSREPTTKPLHCSYRPDSFLNGSFYDQINGVAMGSPLAPVLANLSTGHHENLWLDYFQGSEILFYRRYVDDTCLFISLGT